MDGLVDKDQERARLEKQAAKMSKDIEGLEKRLGGSNFLEKVCGLCRRNAYVLVSGGSRTAREENMCITIIQY